MPDVVEVSAKFSMGGLYLTPDLWFFASQIWRADLADAVQKIIHNQQPTTQSYANFADHVSNEYHEWIRDKDIYYTGEFLMALCGITSTKWFMAHHAESMVTTAIAIYLRSNGYADDGEYPRIIPKEFDDMRFDRLWNIDRDAFRRILRVDPWLTGVENLRGQFVRTKTLFTNRPDIPNQLVQQNKDAVERVDKMLADKNFGKRFLVGLKERDAAKKAIKRAVKLHERVSGNLDDVKTLLSFKPLLIEGCAYDYRLTMSEGTLFEYTLNRDSKMTPVHMDIIDPTNDVALASACVYFDDTSILDHVLNVKLHAANMETELKMLKAAHIVTTKRAFYDDPLLPKLKGIHDPVTAPLHTIESIFLYGGDKAHQSLFGAAVPALYPIAKEVLKEACGFPQRYYDLLDQGYKFNVWEFVDGEDPEVPFVDSKALAFVRTITKDSFR